MTKFEIVDPPASGRGDIPLCYIPIHNCCELRCLYIALGTAISCMSNLSKVVGIEVSNSFETLYKKIHDAMNNHYSASQNNSIIEVRR